VFTAVNIAIYQMLFSLKDLHPLWQAIRYFCGLGFVENICGISMSCYVIVGIKEATGNARRSVLRGTPPVVEMEHLLEDGEGSLLMQHGLTRWWRAELGCMIYCFVLSNVTLLITFLLCVWATFSWYIAALVVISSAPFLFFLVFRFFIPAIRNIRYLFLYRS
jgi:hypothetical protein